MFQRAKSFIIRRKKDADHELELPDSSHLVRRPVTANMQDRINVRAIQKNPVVKPNMDFNTLRMKSTSLENVAIPQQTILQKTPMVLSSDGLDTIRRKKELQKKTEQQQKPPRYSVKPQMTNRINTVDEPRRKKSDIIEEEKKESRKEVTRNASQKTKLFRVSSRRNKRNHDQTNEFIFVKMAEK